MINPQWLELPISRTIFYGPKDVRAIEVRLYFDILEIKLRLCCSYETYATLWTISLPQNSLNEPESLRIYNDCNCKIRFLSFIGLRVPAKQLCKI